jgi:hypothetical protein
MNSRNEGLTYISGPIAWRNILIFVIDQEPPLFPPKPQRAGFLNQPGLAVADVVSKPYLDFQLCVLGEVLSPPPRSPQSLPDSVSCIAVL